MSSVRQWGVSEPDPGAQRLPDVRAALGEAERQATELGYFKASVDAMFERLDRHIPEDYDGDEAYEAIFERWVNDVVAERDQARDDLVRAEETIIDLKESLAMLDDN